MIPVLIGCLLVIGAVLALVIGRGIRIADEREGAPGGPVPARLDPRAGQHAARTGQQLFTLVLAVIVLVGLGLAGAHDAATAAGGVQ